MFGHASVKLGGSFDRQTSSKRFVRRAVGLIVALVSGNAHAIDWVGTTSQDWNDATNWNAGTVPTDTGAGVSMATGNFPKISSDVSGVPSEIVIGGWWSVGRVDHVAGTINVARQSTGWPPGWMLIGFGPVGNGTYNLADTATTGGATTGFGTGSGTINLADAIFLGEPFGDRTQTGTSILNINTTGMVNVAATVHGAAQQFTSTINMDSGWLNVGGELWVAQDYIGTLNQSGGLVSSANWLVLSRFLTANGTYNMTGGTVEAAYMGGNAVLVSEGGTGTLNVSGGTFKIGDDDTLSSLWVCENYAGGVGTGTLNLSGTGQVIASDYVDLTRNANGVGIINLNGGSLKAKSIFNDGGGVGTLNFNGGTVKPAEPNGNFIWGITTANVRDGGGVVDTNGFDLTISQVLTHSAIVGDAAVDGGMKKIGDGVLTLAAANTYTGRTTVSQGTLVLMTASGADQPVLGGVNVASPGGADIAGGTLVFDYAGVASPATALLAKLHAGYLANFTSGPIMSTVATSSLGLGWIDDAGASRLTVRSAFYGDANMDNTVGFDDLLALAQNYNGNGPWTSGDFNYDGQIGFDDLLSLAQNYGTSGLIDVSNVGSSNFAADWALAQSLVPEPTSIAILAVLGTGFTRRSRLTTC